MDLAGFVIGLGMITVDLIHRVRGDVAIDQFEAAADREAKIRQPTLVASPACVTDHHRQRVHAQMVMIAPAPGAAQQVTAIAAAKIDDDRRDPAKEILPDDRPLVGIFLQRGLGPFGGFQDLPRERHAKLSLDPTGIHECGPLKNAGGANQIFFNRLTISMAVTAAS